MKVMGQVCTVDRVPKKMQIKGKIIEIYWFPNRTLVPAKIGFLSTRKCNDLHTIRCILNEIWSIRAERNVRVKDAASLLVNKNINNHTHPTEFRWPQPQTGTRFGDGGEASKRKDVGRRNMKVIYDRKQIYPQMTRVA